MEVSDSPRSAADRPARVIGIGASAGGVDALSRLMPQIPPELPHAVCVVLHVAASGRGLLSGILDRRCRLPVATADDGAPLRAAHVYVAPPDRHLLVREQHIALSRGPKENGVRPAVDVMFRSLAASHGRAAVAVVVSGALCDGSGGAAAVARAGGTVIVQEPRDATVPSMPERTLAAVAETDLVLGAERIGVALGELALRPAARLPRRRSGPAGSEASVRVEPSSAVEAAMWAALEALQERAELLRKVAARRSAAHPRTHASPTAAAADALERAELIRRALEPMGVDE
jgi:two-component system, chemotaxis family, protein-glutamate methylesterase/glutaminase